MVIIMTKHANKQAPRQRIAEGKSAVSSAWREPGKVIPENIAGFASNIHIADQVNNQTRQVYPEVPEQWVTTPDGDTDEQLTQWLRERYERLNCFNIQRCVLPDTYIWGCMPYSVGIVMNNRGAYDISEIRRLPPESFTRAPPIITQNTITPNPLMPGIIIDDTGAVQAWQTDPAAGTQTQINNIQFVKAPGAPTPSGAAYLYPCYFIVARMEFAAQAQIQQVSRIGAPRMIPKVVDDATDDDYENLKKWFSSVGKFWDGKNNSVLIPPGIEFPTLNIKEGTVATGYMNQCVEWIRNYCNPMSDLTSTSGLGQSDAGRMEMWCNFISAEQTLSEKWLEHIFDYVLEANGWEGYKTHIELKRPSIDRSAIKLQALNQAVASGAITKEEIRDNLTEILEIKEWSPEIDAELSSSQQYSPYQMVMQNSVMGKTITIPEEQIMHTTEQELAEIYAKGADEIKQILNSNHA